MEKVTNCLKGRSHEKSKYYQRQYSACPRPKLRTANTFIAVTPQPFASSKIRPTPCPRGPELRFSAEGHRGNDTEYFRAFFGAACPLKK
jgi:hypothetical protein